MIKPSLDQLVFGSILGDGHITSIKTPKGNCSLEIEHHSPQGPYLHWKADLLRSFGIELTTKDGPLPELKGRARTYHNLLTARNPYFTNLRNPNYFQGKKQINIKTLKQLNEFGLAIWFMDDGHVSENIHGANGYLHTESYGRHGNLIVQYYFIDRWKIYPRLWKDSKGFWLLRFPKSEFLQLVRLIEPYVRSDMAYKLACSKLRRSLKIDFSLRDRCVDELLNLGKLPLDSDTY